MTPTITMDIIPVDATIVSNGKHTQYPRKTMLRDCTCTSAKPSAETGINALFLSCVLDG